MDNTNTKKNYNINESLSFMDINNTNIIILPPGFILNNKVFDIKPRIIKIGSDEYTFNKKISHGTYGYVYLYSSYKNKIAIKISDDVNDLYVDIIVLNKLKKKKCDNVFVESYVCDYKYKYQNEEITTKIIIMDNYDGNILDFVYGIFNNMDKNIKYVFILNIIKQISISIKCLYDNDLFYADITPNNILYKNTSFHSVKIVLGDLGGACCYDNAYTVSFPSIKNKNSDGFIKNISEFDLIWGICVTMMYLLVDQKEITFYKLCDTFLYKNIKNNEDEKIYDEINKIKNIILSEEINENIKKIYENIFLFITNNSFDIHLDDLLNILNINI